MKNKNQLRTALLGTAATFKSAIIKDADGNEYEVKQPSIRGRSDIRKLSTSTDEKGEITFEPFDFMLQAAIHCTFVPGTDDRVFCPEDFAALQALPAGGIIDELGQKASEFCNVAGKPEDTKKPSSETASDS